MTMNSELEFKNKLEILEAEILSEDFEEILPLINEAEASDSFVQESVDSEIVEMSTCTCSGGCGSNYSHGNCTCSGNCGSNYHK